MVNLTIALLTMAAAALAEWLHARRVRRVAWLAFGPTEQPRPWVRLAAPLRVVAAGALAWGLLTLLEMDSAALESLSVDERREIQHIVIALDVSPSMHLVDAGPRGDQSRGERAREVLASFLNRLDGRRARVSIVAFYSDARPVVIDTFDPEVVANVLADLPLEHAFDAGKTNLYAGVRAAAELAKPWREKSATLVIVSDGDTLPAQEIPTLPRAYATTIALGVGNTARGTFIDDHSSRQDVQSLERLALRLGGNYYDVNTRHMPTGLIRSLPAPPAPAGEQLDLRGMALSAVAAGAAVLALLPVLLSLAGTGYRPWRLQRQASGRKIGGGNALGTRSAIAARPQPKVQSIPSAFAEIGT